MKRVRFERDGMQFEMLELTDEVNDGKNESSSTTFPRFVVRAMCEHNAIFGSCEDNVKFMLTVSYGGWVGSTLGHDDLDHMVKEAARNALDIHNARVALSNYEYSP